MRELLIILLLSIPLAATKAADDAMVKDSTVTPGCLMIPTAFSLNDDCSTCDHFNITSSCPVDYFGMEIYDRWGTKVFGTYDMHKQWDGSLNGSYLPVGCYVYMIRYRQAADSALLSYRGTVVFLH